MLSIIFGLEGAPFGQSNHSKVKATRRPTGSIGTVRRKNCEQFFSKSEWDIHLIKRGGKKG